MKKIITVMMLAAGITGSALAQSYRADKVFEVSESNFENKYKIDLGKGNSMIVLLKNTDDLEKIKNIDSLLTVFLEDLTLLKDSLAGDASSVRIDYLPDAAGVKKIRIQKFAQQGSGFVIRGNDLALLKTEQDTVNFIGVVPFVAKYPLRKAFNDIRYYRVSFYVNNLDDLNMYTQKLNDKVAAITPEIKSSRWIKDKSGDWHIKNGNQSISAKNPNGYIAANGDFLLSRISANVQNYKNYFVPSFNLGIELLLSNGKYKRQIGFSWEPNFLFTKDLSGKLKTYRNDFLTLTYGQGPIKDNDVKKQSELLSVFSLSYLAKRKGDFFEKNTFRLSAGGLSLFNGKTKIEPMLYFTDLFKGTTPGIRWVQQF